MEKIRLFLILGIFIIIASFVVLYFDSKDDTSKLVGISIWDSNVNYEHNIDYFKATLAEYGYVEGTNIEYIIKNPQGDKFVQKEIIQDFVDRKVDLIYTLTTPGTKIAKETTTEIPIVFSVVTYPVDAGLIESFENSGNNLVGMSNYIDVKKQLELFIDIYPIETIGFIHRYDEINSSIQFREMKELAQEIGINLVDLPFKNLIDAESVLMSSDVSVFYNACDTLIQNGLGKISIDVADIKQIPVFGCLSSDISNGALAGNVADLDFAGQRSAQKAFLILISDSPLHIHSEHQLFDNVLLNYESANNLNITFPDHVIQLSSKSESRDVVG